MGAIKKAFQSIGKAFESIGQIAKGLVTLDLKSAAAGIKGLAAAGMDLARNVINLTPAAFAANKLLDGALDKVLRKAQDMATKMTDSMVDNVEQGLSNIKKGVVNTAKGIAKGNLKQVLNGIKDLSVGAMETASNFGPGGIAKNVARLAVDAAIDMAVEKTTQVAAKVLDPHGTSKLGGMAVDMVGSATETAMTSGGRRGRGHGGDGSDVDMPTRRTDTRDTNKPDTDASNPNTRDIDSRDNNSVRRNVSDDIHNSAADMAEDCARDAIQMGVNELTGQLEKLVNPNGTSQVASTGTNIVGNAAEDAANDAVTNRRDRADSDREARRSRQTQQTRQNQQTEQAKDAQETREKLPGTRDAVKDAAQNAVDQAIQAALDAVIQKALDQLALKDPTGVAALAGLKSEDIPPDASSHVAAANRGAQMRQQVKQQMRERIETAVRTTVEDATQTITDAAMQYGADALENPGKVSSDGLKKVAQDTMDKVVGQVSGAVGGAIGEAAAKAKELGLDGNVKTRSIEILHETIQHADEVRIRA